MSEQATDYVKTVQARQWDGTVEDATRVIDWLLSIGKTARYYDPHQVGINITHAGMPATAFASPSDFVTVQPDGSVRIYWASEFLREYRAAAATAASA